MISARSNRFIKNWSSWLVVLCVSGYPAVAVTGTFLNLDNSPLSIFFRVAVILLSVILLFQMSFTKSLWKSHLLLLIFFGVYLTRLLWDWLVAGVPGAGIAIIFFLGTVILPSIALGLAGSFAISQELTAWRFVKVGGLICSLASLMVYFGWGEAKMINIDSTAGRVFFEALNPISLGHVAVTTLIAVLYLTLFPMRPIVRLLLLIVSAIAVVTLLNTASRGPLLALLISTVAFSIVSRRWRWVALLTLLLSIIILGTDSPLFERLLAGIEDDSSLERLFIQSNAIAQFLNNPLIGSAYTELLTLEYPHNLFIETLMALGIIGIVLLLLILFKTFRISRRLISRDDSLFSLLLLQYFIATQFSGAIWTASSFFVLIALVSSNVFKIRVENSLPLKSLPGHQIL